MESNNQEYDFLLKQCHELKRLFFLKSKELYDIEEHLLNIQKQLSHFEVLQKTQIKQKPKRIKLKNSTYKPKI